jgi:putative SOS response-associated peptidase YedK
MCTYYEVHRQKLQRQQKRMELIRKVFAAAAADYPGIRPTEPAPVVRADGAAEIMSWGFRRQFARKDAARRPSSTGASPGEKLSLHPLFGTCYAEAVEDDEPPPVPPGKTAWKPVVNAREDKLDSPTWREAFAERRCIVPVSAFYEWSGPAGAKVTHRFHQDGGIFWVAGMWEESPPFGRCYTMLTTEPNREVAAVHDRQLVVLLDEEIEPYLAGESFASFRRPDGILQVTSGVPNPLASRKPPRPEQGELF